MAANVNLTARNLVLDIGGIRLLNDVSFTLEGGTVAACMGPNGAGKTSLLNLLSGWTVPTAGSVEINGRIFSRLSPEKAHRAGLVRRFDPPKIIGQLTTLENIRLASRSGKGGDGLFAALFRRDRFRRLRSDLEARDRSVLERVGLGERHAVEAARLSVGEQKMLDLAVALCSDPKLLLLDEPLKDRVDERHRLLVQRELRALADRGAALLFVEHDVEAVRAVADRVFLLEKDGRLGWNGSTSDRETWARVEAVYRTATDPAARPAREHFDSASRGLKVRGLSANRGGVEVIRDINLDLLAGEISLLRGENGAGKSSLLFALLGLIESRGAVSLAASDLTALSSFERARAGLLLVTQENKVFGSITVRENLLLGVDRSETDHSAALERVFGWFPVLRERQHLGATHLSAGQKQMVALARALLRNPRALLLDEPSSGLDPHARRVARDLVRAQSEGGTAVLMVEHAREELDVAADSTYRLRGGSLQEKEV